MRSPEDEEFATFVAAASRRLLHTAYLIVGDRDGAEDLLQAALERAYRHWKAVRRRDSPEAYVRRILVNLATDTWRSRRRLRSVALDDSMLPASSDTDLVSAREALLACIRQLPVGQRAVLVLRYLDDLTEAQTARVLGCSIGTVKSQHARAIARLRQLLPDGKSA
jgi:RNA polymerase sigma-70 factor (sigma-E family)